MCLKRSNLWPVATLPAPDTPFQPLPRPPTGSRRRRLWDLDSLTHCPVIGVCIPIATLRRLVLRKLAAPAPASDYVLHVGAVNECRTRNHLSETLHRHLEHRCQLAVRRAAVARTTEALAAWWDQSRAGPDLPGALWATLTHPRCSPELQAELLGQVHMLQHQVGMSTRLEHERVEQQAARHASLARELASTQARAQRQAEDAARRIEALEADLVRLRALLVARQTELEQQRQALAALEAAVPQLRERQALAEEAATLRGTVLDLRREVAGLRAQSERQDAPGQAPQARRQGGSRDAVASGDPGVAVPGPLADRSVLCVGGRTACVPRYRGVVERRGGRFLHHDGGDEDSNARLEATLAAADLVICQAGCISHDAYWRVKNHCKRTGKRCVFVEMPSQAALERALKEAEAAVNRYCD